MEGETFDALIRRAFSDASRRSLLHAGIGVLVASGLTRLDLGLLESVEAKSRRHKQRARRQKQRQEKKKKKAKRGPPGPPAAGGPQGLQDRPDRRRRQRPVPLRRPSPVVPAAVVRTTVRSAAMTGLR